MRRTALIVYAVSALLAGCGGSGSGGIVSQPKPTAPIESQVGPFNKAIASGSCKGIAELALAITRRVGKPGVPPTKRECDYYNSDPGSPLRVLKGVKFQRSAEYGTAALMEGNAPPGSQSAKTFALWAVDVDGKYRFLATSAGDAQIDKSPPPGNNAAKNARAFLISVKRGHCDPKLLNPLGSMLEGSTPQNACKKVDHGHISAPALKDTAKIEPEKMGQSRDFVFFGVPTKKAYFTLIMANQGAKPGGPPSKDYTVFDIVPNTHLRIR